MAARKLVTRVERPGAELQLWENRIEGRKEWEMVINGVFIMASYNHLSSELLVKNAVQRVDKREGLDILIGGLGMGYTVKEACRYPEVVRIEVVELEPVVVEWNRLYFQDENAGCLDDARVRVVNGDFHDYVMVTPHVYDIITMDIDNGPMMLVQEGNRRVYDSGFFRKVREILAPGGVFAVWSCNHDPRLAERLEEEFSVCEMDEVIEEHNRRQVPYYLYFAYDLKPQMYADGRR